MKKVLALTLAVVVALGMASVSFAASSNWVSAGGMGFSTAVDADTTGTPEYKNTVRHHYVTFPGAGELYRLTSNSVGAVQGTGSVFAAPDEGTLTFRFPMEKSLFEIDNSGSIPFTAERLESSRVRVNSKRVSGGNVLNGISIVNIGSGNSRTAAVQVEFIKEHRNTSDVSFEYEIWLSDKNGAIEGTRFSVYGTFENHSTEVDGDETYYSTEDGTVLDVISFSKNVEVYTGNGVTLFMNLLENTKYYVRADMTLSAEDEALIYGTILAANNVSEVLAANNYANAIEGVITMRTAATRQASFKSAKVEFDFGDTFYVYGEDGSYLGTSDQTVPFSNKYYLATTQLTNVTAEAPVVDAPVVTGEPSLDNPGTGGQTAPVNANDNPGTGC